MARAFDIVKARQDEEKAKQAHFSRLVEELILAHVSSGQPIEATDLNLIVSAQCAAHLIIDNCPSNES